MEINEEVDEIKTKFINRIPLKQDFIFIFPEGKNNVWDHDADDIIMKLLIPVPV